MTEAHERPLAKLVERGAVTTEEAAYYRTLDADKRDHFYHEAGRTQRGLANNERRRGGGHSERDYRGAGSVLQAAVKTAHALSPAGRAAAVAQREALRHGTCPRCGEDVHHDNALVTRGEVKTCNACLSPEEHDALRAFM